MRPATAFPLLLSIAALAVGAPTSVPDATPQTCSLFPWFIGPRIRSDCSGPEPDYNPNSGPAPGRNTTCELMDTNNEDPARWTAVDLTIACGGYEVTFYVDNQCRDRGVTVGGPRQCIVPPAGFAFIAFSAYRTA